MSSVLNFVSTSGLSYNKTSFEKSKWLFCIFTLYELYNSMGVHSNCLNNKRLPRSIFSVLRSIAQPWHLKWKKKIVRCHIYAILYCVCNSNRREYFTVSRGMCVLASNWMETKTKTIWPVSNAPSVIRTDEF